LTVETNRVMERRIVQLAANTTQLDLSLDPVLRGGAFVTATVLRPIDPAAENWLPHRAMGMARLRIDHEDHRLPITITAPSHIEPGAKIWVTVRTPPPCSPRERPVVHVWAVDEGILLTTAY